MKRTLLAFDIDRDELSSRMAEAFTGLERSLGLSASDFLQQMGSARQWNAAAKAAVNYIHDCINAGLRPS